jgi:hypothetical protein
MNRLGFKEWLSKLAPDGAGEIWDNRTNADLDFGRTGARSKYRASERKKPPLGEDEPEDQDTAGPAEIDPEKLFLGVPKKRVEKLNRKSNIGDEYGLPTV